MVYRAPGISTKPTWLSNGHVVDVRKATCPCHVTYNSHVSQGSDQLSSPPGLVRGYRVTLQKVNLTLRSKVGPPPPKYPPV